MSQDISIALGPGLQAVNLAGLLLDARAISPASMLLPVAWAAAGYSSARASQGWWGAAACWPSGQERW
jgi:hypothetical protein